MATTITSRIPTAAYQPTIFDNQITLVYTHCSVGGGEMWRRVQGRPSVRWDYAKNDLLWRRNIISTLFLEADTTISPLSLPVRFKRLSHLSFSFCPSAGLLLSWSWLLLRRVGPAVLEAPPSSGQSPSLRFLGSVFPCCLAHCRSGPGPRKL